MSQHFMEQALKLARVNLGQTWPNPSVGAIVVKDGKVIGEGWTARGGRPHAETAALSGISAEGATLYVTLEPCSHHGKTPPCTDAIIAAGIAEVVIAAKDPNPQVSGIDALQKAGIKVRVEEEAEAYEIGRGFFSVIEKGRPYIAMKIATSKDGKIAADLNVRSDITGPNARQHVQELRAEFDAILTGIGTALVDDPLLTVRIPGMEYRSPVRVLLDSQGRLPANSKLRQTEKDVPLWIYKRDDEVIEDLTKKGITRLMIEGGQGVNSYFLKNGLVDRIYHYEAPHLMLPEGVSAFKDGLSLDGWQQVGNVVALGPDICTILEKK